MKKTLYAKMKKEEEEREAEWAKKYRDRVSPTVFHSCFVCLVHNMRFACTCKRVYRWG